MKLGDIKIEALKIMFATYNTDLSISELDKAMQDENYGSYLVNMPGSINRCFSVLEEKRVLPVKSHTLTATEGLASGSFIRFDLSAIIKDYFDIDRLVYQNESEYEGEAEYRMEGNTLVLPVFGTNEVYSVVYYPSIERVSMETEDTKELNIPNRIAENIPYFIKGDLYRDDEPSEANEARNWFEVAMDSIVESMQTKQGKIVSKFSQTEI